MKRIGYIYENIYTHKNLKEAIKNASKGKKDRKQVKYVLEHMDACIANIQQMLESRTYRPSKMRQKTITDGISKKQRTIFVPKFYPDQIIQWAVLLQIQPVLTKGISDFTCASIPGRGIHYGKRFVERWLRSDRKHTKYCLKLDVHHFYPSINHDCLKSMLRRKFKDKKLLRLLDAIIDSESGLPIGSITSQWFANFYLQDFDHFAKEQLHAKHYIRYMDDIVIFGANKRKLHKAFDAVKQQLCKIGLRIKHNWQVFKTDSRGVDFLGFRFFHGKTILRRAVMLRISRKVRRTAKLKTWNYHNCAAIISYLGWIKHSNSYGFYQRWIKPYVDIKKCKGVIRNENIKRQNATIAVYDFFQPCCFC